MCVSTFKTICWVMCVKIGYWVCDQGVVPRVVHSKRGQNDHFVLTRAEAGRRRRALAVHRRDSRVLRNMVTTSGPVRGLSASSGDQVLKQESRPKRRHSVAAWRVLTKLRVNLAFWAHLGSHHRFKSIE